jgi:hypothetical protein
MMKKSLFALMLVVIAAPLFAADGPYVPTDIERAGWTSSDMNSLRTALAAYHSDYGSFPDVKTMEEVRALIEPKYIMHTAVHDAWGHPFHYERHGKDGYLLVSAGADGKFQPEGWSQTGRNADLNVDAVATEDGRWLQLSWKLW